MLRSLCASSSVFIFAGLLGLGIGACKGGGSNNPGTVTAIQGSRACPQQVPKNGRSCPRGQVDFCIYRTTGGDFACTCGKSWTCAAK